MGAAALRRTISAHNVKQYARLESAVLKQNSLGLRTKQLRRRGRRGRTADDSRSCGLLRHCRIKQTKQQRWSPRILGAQPLLGRLEACREDVLPKGQYCCWNLMNFTGKGPQRDLRLG